MLRRQLLLGFLVKFGISRHAVTRISVCIKKQTAMSTYTHKLFGLSLISFSRHFCMQISQSCWKKKWSNDFISKPSHNPSTWSIVNKTEILIRVNKKKSWISFTCVFHSLENSIKIH
jgi:hypothetical protein